MRRHRTIDTGQIEPDLPITPMLDMTFQLLAFFIMTFNPSPIEGHLDLALPKEIGGPSATVSNMPLDEDDELTVRVPATASGAIEGINVLVKGAAEETALGTDSTKLFQFLKDRSAKSGKVGKLRLEMGDTLNYQFVIKLIDESSRAGWKNVSPAAIDKK